jgi:acetoin:2,6-dichlorophenolindophenol oxidoreductase subunit alpha
VTAVARPAADRASAYGLEPIVIDGNDADVVYETAQVAIDRARRGEGPSLIEALTYRHTGHSRADPATYRPQEEVDAWLARDPIPMYAARLLEAGATQQELDQIEQDTMAAVEAAIDAAKAMPEPALETMGTNMWSDGGAAWRT